MKTGIISNEKYSLVRIQRIRNLLEAAAEKGNPRFFEIFVDDLKVVDKTNDMECFDDYKGFMDEDTKMLRIQIYTASDTSPRNDKFIFSLNEQAKENKKEELSGLEVENRIAAAIEKERTRNENIRLQQELETVKEQLDDAEAYAEELRMNLEKTKIALSDLQKRKITLSEMNSGRLLGFATDYFVKNYPGISKKLPIISTLSGFLAEDAESTSGAVSEKEELLGTASFTLKANAEEKGAGFDKVTMQKMSFFSDMEAAFDEVQLTQVLEIIKALIVYPSEITSLHDAFYKRAEKKPA